MNIIVRTVVILSFVGFFFLAIPAMAALIIEGRYESPLGYVFEPPEGWVKCDRSTYEGLKDNLPVNLAKIDLERVDAVFYLDTRPQPNSEEDKEGDSDARADEDSEPYFADSLSFMAIRNVPSIISKEIAVSLADESLSLLKSSRGSYPEISRLEADLDKGFEEKPFVVTFRYMRSNGIVVISRNYIFPFSQYTLIANCTFQRISGSQSAGHCENAVKSLRPVKRR